MVQGGAFLTADAVYDMRCSMERELRWQVKSYTPCPTGEGIHAGIVSTTCFIASRRIQGRRWRDRSQRVQLDTQNGIDVRAIVRTDYPFFFCLSFLRSAVPGRILVGLTMGRVRDLASRSDSFLR